MKNRLTLASLSVIAIVFTGAVLASPDQPSSPAPHEVKAEVPELTEFHTVIAQLWHEAWPNKDIAALSAMLPEIQSGAAKVEKAELPGILRDRKEAWDAGVKKLAAIVAEYATAVEKKEPQPILDAGEKLHAQFESLVRTIRPALKEIDAFHRSLYTLYHYDMPAGDMAKIRASAADLKLKMADLDKATLPPRLQPRQEAFAARRADLGKAVSDLSAAAESGKDLKAVKEAIEAVHAKYVALEGVF